MKKKPLVVANWKATKTIKETIEWVKRTKPKLEEMVYLEVVVCPSFTSLPFVASLFKDTSIKVGAQNVSHWPDGPYTGEVTAAMIDGLADYCIVGHSERRRKFGETNEEVNSKINHLSQFKIKSVVCISNLDEANALWSVKDKITVVAYEPLFAIGTDKPDTPENAKKMSTLIKKALGEKIKVIYGGSVDPGNVANFTNQPEIDGVLPGRASWEPENFLNLLDSIRLNSS
jgi:triosephosphate isomerase